MQIKSQLLLLYALLNTINDVLKNREVFDQSQWIPIKNLHHKISIKSVLWNAVQFSSWSV